MSEYHISVQTGSPRCLPFRSWKIVNREYGGVERCRSDQSDYQRVQWRVKGPWTWKQISPFCCWIWMPGGPHLWKVPERTLNGEPIFTGPHADYETLPANKKGSSLMAVELSDWNPIGCCHNRGVQRWRDNQIILNYRVLIGSQASDKHAPCINKAAP